MPQLDGSRLCRESLLDADVGATQELGMSSALDGNPVSRVKFVTSRFTVQKGLCAPSLFVHRHVEGGTAPALLPGKMHRHSQSSFDVVPDSFISQADPSSVRTGLQRSSALDART